MSNGELEYISERDFEVVWGAQSKPDGEFYEYRDLVGLEIGKIWTVYEDGAIDESGDSDNNLYAMPGIVPSFALGYLVTQKGWSTDTLNAIWCRDDDDMAAEERRLFHIESMR